MATIVPEGRSFDASFPRPLIPSRREMLVAAAALTGAACAQPSFSAALRPLVSTPGDKTMSTITVKDGTQIFYKEWGTGQPIVFHHGWPLSGDDWDAQMMFFSEKGFRVVAHDRRGHGRSSPASIGNDMDTYAADVAAVTSHLGLRDAVHIGHSTGGGEVIRYVAKYGSGGRVAKAVTIGAIPPVLGKTATNPNGVPPEAIAGIRAGVIANRAQFYEDFAAGPFYGFNRPGAAVSKGVINNWVRQAMVGDIKAQVDCIAVFTETDFTADLKAIQQPVLLMHGEDDQVAPIDTTSRLAVKLLKHGTLKTYPGFPHGMATTHAEVINADILKFIRS
jgi:non-heme chloroperoxidase